MKKMKETQNEKKQIASASVSEDSRKKELASAICNDVKCHIHGSLKARGKTFEGVVIKKFPKRLVIEFERMIYSKKYERYSRAKTKLHARLPDCMEKDIHVGDLIRIQETRPLSKIIHFVVICKIKSKEDRK